MIDTPRTKLQRLINSNVLLTKEEERELLERAQNGDNDARDELITRNLGLVAKSARYHKEYTTLPYDDLMQEGTFGLFTAIDKFDLNKEWRFSTYATWWIRHYIGRHMTNHGRTIRIPDRIIELRRHYLNEREEYMREFGVEPSTSELSALLGVSISRVDEMLQNSAPISSLDYRLQSKNNNSYNSEYSTMGDTIPDTSISIEDEVVYNDLMEKLNQALDQLEPIEKILIIKLFNLNPIDPSQKPPTRTKLAKEFGFQSVQKMTVVVNGALSKLAELLKDVDGVDEILNYKE